MKKKIFSTMLLMLMVAALMIFTAGCNAEETTTDNDAAARIAQLEQENAALQAQLDKLTAELGRTKEKVALQNWNLDVEAWGDGNGATVTFTAAPINYEEGQRAALSIRMGDLEAESTNCVWDGSVFTGSVELSAADGYSYYCILTNLDGSQDEVELNTPDNVTNEALVYLGSSLSSYANLIVEDWEATGNTLTIKSGYLQCQMPRLTFNGTNTQIDSSVLVLKLNDEEVSRQDVTLSDGEGEGSFETTISNQTFNMPTLEEDYQLDLWLEVSLSTGSTISVSGGSWYSNNGELQLVVG